MLDENYYKTGIAMNGKELSERKGWTGRALAFSEFRVQASPSITKDEL